MRWTVGFLDDGVKAELDDQPADIRARFLRIVELIQAHGLERVREPYVKHLDGRIWEMRMEGQGRHRPGPVRHGHGAPGRRREGVHEEDGQDPAQRNRDRPEEVKEVE